MGEGGPYAAGTANDGVTAEIAEIADSSDGLPGRVGKDGEVERSASWSHCGFDGLLGAGGGGGGGRYIYMFEFQPAVVPPCGSPVSPPHPKANDETSLAHFG